MLGERTIKVLRLKCEQLREVDPMFEQLLTVLEERQRLRKRNVSLAGECDRLRMVLREHGLEDYTRIEPEPESVTEGRREKVEKALLTVGAV